MKAARVALQRPILMEETSPVPADNPTAENAVEASAPAVPPMTATLMGRLFVVPALVVVVLLVVAVVVILFGASPIEKPRSIAELIADIEMDSGDRSLGNIILSPKSKQTWQAAQELAIRFDKGHLDGESAEAMAGRLISIIRERRTSAANSSGAEDVNSGGLAMQQFLILALAKLKTPSACEAMTDWLGDTDPQIRRIALQGLAELREMPVVSESLPKMYPLLEDSAQEVRIVAALAIASIAPRGDKTAIDRIAAMPATDRDSRMNQATALAKLGSTSTSARLMILNMLDREYWRKLPPDANVNSIGAIELSDQDISARLIALTPIAATLDDQQIHDAIKNLSLHDISPKVRDAAIAALANDSGDDHTDSADGAGAHAGRLFDASGALRA